MKTIQELASEAGFLIHINDHSLITAENKETWVCINKELEVFAALVREDERQIIIAKNAPEIERVNEHFKNLERKIAVAAIKEALAKDVPETNFGNMAEQPAPYMAVSNDRISVDPHTGNVSIGSPPQRNKD